MKNKTKRLISAGLCCALLLGLTCCKKAETSSSPDISDISDISESVEPSDSSVEATPTATPTEKVKKTDGPVDFDELQSKNSDIYAYLLIPDSLIKQPIVQHPTDDTYYLTHSEYKKKRQSGACFTERRYNTKTFDDPVTILYGHRMRTKVMFSTLQSLYSDKSSFDKHKEIIIYTPCEELHYEVFAAVPYNKQHILYNYNFSLAEHSAKFFDSIRAVREIGANFGEDTTVTTEDKVLILSTCLWGNNDRRYLVLAKLVSRK